MTELYSTSTIKRASPQLGITKVIIETPATADYSDTVAITLGSYGMSATGLLGVTEWVHTTDASVIRQVGGSLNGDLAGYSTTAVSSGVLTITLGTGTNLTHVYEVTGK